MLNDNLTKDTTKIRNEMWNLWEKLSENKISLNEAKTKTVIARTILEAYRIEIAATYASQQIINCKLLDNKK